MDRLRQWFGEEKYQANLETVKRFWRGQGRYIISVNSTQHYYRQVFDDEAILQSAPLHLEAQAGLPGLNLPALFADWGTVTTGKYWGATPRFDSTGGNIFIDPVAQTVEDALVIDPISVDEPSLDAHHAIRLFRQLSEMLETEILWLRTPDMQGTLNTAGLVLNQEELLIAMYTEKASVHAFLSKVCDQLIHFALYLRREAGHRICGNLWPYIFFPDELGISLTEDLMPLLPPDLYLEFGIPYLRRITEALGSLVIHCCGQWGHHARNLHESGLPIAAVEFHYPATRLEELECLADQVVFIPYILLHQQSEFQSTADYYRYLLRETDSRYRFWFACADDSPEMLTFAQEYGPYA